MYKKKLERFFNGGSLRVLDLFAGCGGISLGFQLAGFEIIGAVEIDPDAARTHAMNFCRHEPAEIREIHGRARDITVIEPEDLLEELGFTESADQVVDIIVGGPPCQAYTRVGRAKLREVAEHPEAYKQDARGNLYLRYLEYVRRLKPLALVMENVPDVLNYGGHNVAEETCEVLESLGYTCRYTLLNSSFYGVPQMRERMFLVAYREEFHVEVNFPDSEYWIDLPRGYHGSRQVALKTVAADLFSDTRHYVEVPRIANNLPLAVTAQQALGDLPSKVNHLTPGGMKRGARRFDELEEYTNEAEPGTYAYLMRNWPGFESTKGVSDHVIRSLPRDYAIFRRMLPGDQYPQAYSHARQMFEEELRKRYGRKLPAVDSPEYQNLYNKIVPPYDPAKFPNKWRKMEPDQPARTLMAHLGKDSYSHIHYDSQQARTISVREAARLQSFPDGFVFSGTMNPAFKQIGNAVPPLLANAVARSIFHTLTQIRANTNATQTRVEAVDTLRSDILQAVL
ncbi:DNA cytosine methyltransferase [Spirosoma soli]|uniref:DNA (cytosine-5-)-methyltransferase n=1 Tax=Spirosoma soli TaxID=1770529 RepID=A0ABW5MC94_9BACT